MNVLVLGSGGREHTLIWKISQSPLVNKIYALPGNGGTAQIAENIVGKETDFPFIENVVREKNIELVVVGPEVPLVAGITDYLQERKIPVFGPNKMAARFEGSKSYTKQFLEKHNIPTAHYQEFTTFESAIKYVEKSSFPVVIKADGLAAGKGVVIANSLAEATEALKSMMHDEVFGQAGLRVVIEEFLVGEEASLLCFVDANGITPMIPAQDHKTIFDNDQGPNTGGMGTYSPAPVVNTQVWDKIQETIVKKIEKGFIDDGIIFRGILFIGLMICDGLPKVLEFNVRFGDPETQVVIPKLKTDLLQIMQAVVNDKLNTIKIEWNNDFAVCVVLASKGYPNTYEKGKEISGLPLVKGVEEPSAIVFHAGTMLSGDKVLTNGGRVLGVTALDKDLNIAISKAYQAVDQIHFAGKYYRTDIAAKAKKYL